MHRPNELSVSADDVSAKVPPGNDDVVESDTEEEESNIDSVLIDILRDDARSRSPLVQAGGNSCVHYANSSDLVMKDQVSATPTRFA